MTVVEREAEIRRLFPLVRQIARRVLRVVGAADIDDLVGDGCVGLIRAVDSYDAARGTALELYARKLIAGAMLNGLRRLDPVSERVRRTLRRADNHRYAVAQERGSLPTLGELERGDAKVGRARIAAYRQATLSLDAPLPMGQDVLADWSSEPGNEVAARAKRRQLGEAIALLPERQRRILALHYGHELSLHAISSRLNVSPQRVSQLHLSALSRLRHTVHPS